MSDKPDDQKELDLGFDDSQPETSLREEFDEYFGENKNGKLFIYRQGVSGDRETLDILVDQLLEPAEIAVRYGPGKYKLILQYTDRHNKRRTTTRTMNFGDTWLPRHVEYLQNKQRAATTFAYSNPIGGANAMGGIESFMNTDIGKTLLLALVNKLTAPSNNEALLLELIKTMAGRQQQPDINTMILKSMLDNTSNSLQRDRDLMRESMKLGAEMGAASNTDDGKKTENILAIVEGITDAAPKIISAFVPKKTVQRKIRQIPGASTYLDDPEKSKEIFRQVSDKIGYKKAVQVADKIFDDSQTVVSRGHDESVTNGHEFKSEIPEVVSL